MASFEVVKILSETIVQVRTDDGSDSYLQLWVTGAARRPRHCSECGKLPKTGARNYAPITHQKNRSMRLCLACVDKLTRRYTERAQR